mmetsp:Transcript_23865/g.26610  ORF Transcript_23865/g.26610 Transcript_23865/m.26610 type:complete len:118 (+) Transcript_23865:505-858(+)
MTCYPKTTTLSYCIILGECTMHESGLLKKISVSDIHFLIHLDNDIYFIIASTPQQQYMNRRRPDKLGINYEMIMMVIITTRNNGGCDSANSFGCLCGGTGLEISRCRDRNSHTRLSL